jgi:hypothetical protein
MATALSVGALATLIAAGSVLAVPVTVGYRDHEYGGGAFRPASDKTQSKAWYTGAGQWWAGMFSKTAGEYRIYKLAADKASWAATATAIDNRDPSRGDYLWDEASDTLYVVSHGEIPDTVPTGALNDSIRVFKYTFNGTSYAPVAGFPHQLPNTASVAGVRGGAPSATIALDSTGDLWVVWPHSGQVRYSKSDDGGVTWSTPAQLPVQGSSIVQSPTDNDNDATSVIAFGAGRVGVMWSDHDNLPAMSGNGYWFADMAAGADPTVAGNWTTVRLPTNVAGDGERADNHINIKTTSDGSLYMVGKTGSDTANCATNKNRPLIEVFERTPAGAWSAHVAGNVGDCNTRPQIVISEELDSAYLFLSAPNGGGAVYRKSAPLNGPTAFDFRGESPQSFEPGIPFIQSATELLIDDVSTTKQVVTGASDIVVIANNVRSVSQPTGKFYLHNFVALPAADTTDPVGTVTVNGGAAATTNPAVSVAVPATDAGSGMSLVRLSNSGTTNGGVLNGAGSTSFVYTTPLPWTLSGGEGTKTVFAQWRDAAGNWSTPISDEIVLDNTAPTGTVEINAGATTTTTVTVTLGLTASDGGAGVTSALISNSADFSGATSVPFAASVPWVLASGNGPKTVYVKFVDAAGNVSASAVQDDITLISADATPPNPLTTLTHIVAGSNQTGIPVRLNWNAGSDNAGGSGVAGYVIQRQVNGGPFSTVAFVNHPTLTYQANLSTSSATYRYRVLVMDKGRGLTSSGKYTPTFRTLSYSESSSAIRYTGSWGLSSSTIYVGGKARISSTTNSSASLTFTGTRVGWLARTGPVYGSARVYINGSLVKTVNMFSSTYTNKRIVYQASWTTSATRTIRIVVSGTAGHPKIALDQIFVLR